jgi:hypothetical protein
LTEEDLLGVLSQRWGFRLLARKGPVAALIRERFTSRAGAETPRA